MNKIKFNIYLVVLVVSFLLLTVKASAFTPGSTVNPGDNNYGNCVNCEVTSGIAYPYGYRVYIMDDSGSIKAVSNVINSNVSSYKIFSGNKVRKQVVREGNSNLVDPIQVVSNSNYNQFLHTGNSSNFNNVFISSMRLIKPPGSSKYCVSDGGSCLDLTKKSEVAKMLSYLDSYLISVGIYNITAQYLYELWSGNNGSNIYLAAEGLGSLKQTNDGYVVGTCTELVKYAILKDTAQKQNRILLDLCNTANLNNYDAAGYYLLNGSIPTGYLPYTNNIFNRISLGNIKNGNVEGISIFMWKISELFGNTTTTTTNTGGGTCDYKLSVNVPNTCSGTNSGYVSDSANWDCIFGSTKSTNSSTVQNQYLATTNRYCTIYCKESIEMNLPNTGAVAKAGTFFVLGSISGKNTIGPVQYKATSVCRPTTSINSENGTINVALFKEDYENANKTVLQTYDAYQLALLKKAVIDSATQVNVNLTCSQRWCVKAETDCKKYPDKDGCAACIVDNTCSVNQTANAKAWDYRNRDYTNYDNSQSNTGLTDGTCTCKTDENAAVKCDFQCSTKLNADAEIARTIQDYRNAVIARESYLNQLISCNNYNATLSSFSPSVKLGYKDSLYNNLSESKAYTLKGNSYTNSVTNYYRQGNSKSDLVMETLSYINSGNSSVARGYTDQITKYECNLDSIGTNCLGSRTTITYPANVWFEQKTIKIVNYSLPDNINQYVLKPSGLSVNSINTANAAISYDYIPFSNLPIHYSTKSGNYDYMLYLSSFGVDNKFNRYIGTGSSFGSYNYQISTNYGCTFRVKNSPPVTEKGTDLIVRSISLIYPFPGQNGTEINLRDPKTNWKEYYGLDPVSQYIYNNRGVKYYDVYNLDPMYEVTLTPALMRKIKEYNSVQNKKREIYYEGTEKEVTAVLGYSDFTLTCKTDSDGSRSKNCTSQIIRDWGVKGCAIKNSGYTNCGTTVAR